jgi:hypothetical protein
VAAPSKAWVCGRSLDGIVGSNPTGGHGRVSLVSVVCRQVEVSASDWSLVQRSRTECRASECDREAPIMRRPWYTRGCFATGRWWLHKISWILVVMMQNGYKWHTENLKFGRYQSGASNTGWGVPYFILALSWKWSLERYYRCVEMTRIDNYRVLSKTNRTKQYIWFIVT